MRLGWFSGIVPYTGPILVKWSGGVSQWIGRIIPVAHSTHWDSLCPNVIANAPSSVAAVPRDRREQGSQWLDRGRFPKLRDTGPPFTSELMAIRFSEFRAPRSDPADEQTFSMNTNGAKPRLFLGCHYSGSHYCDGRTGSSARAQSGADEPKFIFLAPCAVGMQGRAGQTLGGTAGVRAACACRSMLARNDHGGP